MKNPLRATTASAVLGSFIVLGCGVNREPPPAHDPEFLEPLFTIGAEADANGESSDLLYRPSSVAFDASGNLYVLDNGNHRVAVFSESGEFLRDFGRRGSGPGELNTPRYARRNRIVINGDTVAVSQQRISRVDTMTLRGEPIATIVTSGSPFSIAISDDSLFVSTYPAGVDTPRITRLNHSGAVLDEISVPLTGSSNIADPSLARAAIGVNSDGVVAEAFALWPLIRFHKPDGTYSRQWLDYSWWESPSLRSWFVLPESLLGQPNLTLDSHERLGTWSYFDLEWIDARNEWVGLLNGRILQFFSAEGKPTGSIMLQEMRTGTDPLDDVGIHPRGDLLCGADLSESKVTCYALPTLD